jgi:phosphate starvation-inducible protein PhoH
MTEALTPRGAGAARGRRDARLEFDLTDTERAGDNQRLANLCGPLDANLAQIAAAFGVQVSRRHGHFTVEGSGVANRQARDAIMHFHGLSTGALSLDDIQLGLV